MNPLAISSTNAGRRSELTAPCMFYPIVIFLSYSFMARDGAPNINDNVNEHFSSFSTPASRRLRRRAASYSKVADSSPPREPL